MRNAIKTVREPATKILEEFALPLATNALKEVAKTKGPVIGALGSLGAEILEKGAKEGLKITNREAEKAGFGQNIYRGRKARVNCNNNQLDQHSIDILNSVLDRGVVGSGLRSL